MDLKDNLIQIKGEAYLFEPLKLDRDYTLSVQVSPDSSSDKSNQDGTYNRIFHAKLITATLMSDDGSSVALKTKGKWHVKWRNRVRIWRQENAPTKSEEEVYDWVMSRLVTFADEIIDQLQELSDTKLT